MLVLKAAVQVGVGKPLQVSCPGCLHVTHLEIADGADLIAQSLLAPPLQVPAVPYLGSVFEREAKGLLVAGLAPDQPPKPPPAPALTPARAPPTQRAPLGAPERPAAFLLAAAQQQVGAGHSLHARQVRPHVLLGTLLPI